MSSKVTAAMLAKHDLEPTSSSVSSEKLPTTPDVQRERDSSSALASSGAGASAFAKNQRSAPMFLETAGSGSASKGQQHPMSPLAGSTGSSSASRQLHRQASSSSSVSRAAAAGAAAADVLHGTPQVAVRFTPHSTWRAPRPLPPSPPPSVPPPAECAASAMPPIQLLTGSSILASIASPGSVTRTSTSSDSSAAQVPQQRKSMSPARRLADSSRPGVSPPRGPSFRPHDSSRQIVGPMYPSIRPPDRYRPGLGPNAAPAAARAAPAPAGAAAEPPKKKGLKAKVKKLWSKWVGSKQSSTPAPPAPRPPPSAAVPLSPSFRNGYGVRIHPQASINTQRVLSSPLPSPGKGTGAGTPTKGTNRSSSSLQQQEERTGVPVKRGEDDSSSGKLQRAGSGELAASKGVVETKLGDGGKTSPQKQQAGAVGASKVSTKDQAKTSSSSNSDQEDRGQQAAPAGESPLTAAAAAVAAVRLAPGSATAAAAAATRARPFADDSAAPSPHGSLVASARQRTGDSADTRVTMSCPSNLIDGLPQSPTAPLGHPLRHQQQLITGSSPSWAAGGSVLAMQPGSSTSAQSADPDLQEYLHWCQVSDQLVEDLQQRGLEMQQQMDDIASRRVNLAGLMRATPAPMGFSSGRSIATLANVRARMIAEDERLVNRSQTLSDRAALLGTALQRLQICLLNLRQSSDALRCSDKLAVLQLVLGDVAELLQLWGHPLLAGLPELGDAGKNLIELAAGAEGEDAPGAAGEDVAEESGSMALRAAEEQATSSKQQQKPGPDVASQPVSGQQGAEYAGANSRRRYTKTATEVAGWVQDSSRALGRPETSPESKQQKGEVRRRRKRDQDADRNQGQEGAEDQEEDNEEDDGDDDMSEAVFSMLSEVYAPSQRGGRAGVPSPEKEQPQQSQQQQQQQQRVVQQRNTSFDLQGFEGPLGADDALASQYAAAGYAWLAPQQQQQQQQTAAPGQAAEASAVAAGAGTSGSGDVVSGSAAAYGPAGVGAAVRGRPRFYLVPPLQQIEEVDEALLNSGGGFFNVDPNGPHQHQQQHQHQHQQQQQQQQQHQHQQYERDPHSYLGPNIVCYASRPDGMAGPNQQPPAAAGGQPPMHPMRSSASSSMQQGASMPWQQQGGATVGPIHQSAPHVYHLPSNAMPPGYYGQGHAPRPDAAAFSGSHLSLGGTAGAVRSGSVLGASVGDILQQQQLERLTVGQLLAQLTAALQAQDMQ